MTKISDKPAYPSKVDIVETDYVVGTDSEVLKLTTKSFSFGGIRDFVLAGASPEEGGVLKIFEITYSGVDYDTPSEVLNSLLPNYTVLRYQILIVTVNGYKWIFKLQNVVVGFEQTPVSDSDFIVLPTSIGPTGNGISSITKTNTVGLVDTYTITYTNASTSTFNLTNGSQGPTGPQGNPGTPGAAGKGISTIVKTSTVGAVDTYTITFTDSSTTTFNITNGVNGTNAVNDNQKIITYPTDFTVGNYVLLNADNDFTFFIENGSNAVSITVPAGLVGKFQAGFIQRGTGDVTFVSSGTTITNPIGLKNKGVGYSTYIIQKASTNVYNLLGNTKA